MPVKGVELEEEAWSVEVRGHGARRATFPVSVEGDLGSARRRSWSSSRAALRRAGITVPEELADQLLAGTDFEYPLERLPYEAEVTGVETQEGQMVLSGRVPSIPLGV